MVTVLQSRFTSGELDPLLRGQSDISQYFDAGEKMRNVVSLPQGGFKRRDGLEHLDIICNLIERVESPTISVPNGGTAANANDDDEANGLTTTTDISTSDPYIVVEYDLGSLQEICFIDVVNTNLTAGSSDEFFIQVSTDGIAWTSIGASIEMSTAQITKRRRANGSYRYIRFARIGTTDLGTAKAYIGEFSVFTETASSPSPATNFLSNTRLEPFAVSQDIKYMLLFTDKNIAVYRDSVLVADIRATQFTSDRLPAMKISQSSDTGILVQEDIQPHRLFRLGTDDDWEFAPINFDFIPKFDFVQTSSTPAADITPSSEEGTITIAATAPVFSAGDVQQVIEGNFGRARIIEFVDASSVKAVVEIPFFDINPILSGNWSLIGDFEDVWSATRGYPRTVTFHEGRLWFGGSKSRPQTVWGSNIAKGFFNFDSGTLLDDEAIEFTLDTDQQNSIVNIFSQRTLQVFTIGGEFALRKSATEAITPTNIAILRQTQKGSEPNIRNVEIDGGTIFLQKEGKAILEFIFDDVQNAYSINEVSILSSHLIVTPVSMALRKSTSTEDTALLCIVNSDGTLCTSTIMKGQQVRAFTLQETKGNFKTVGVDGSDIYFIVQRDIDGYVSNRLERFNSNLFVDAGKIVTTGLPTDTFTGLEHLEGEECQVKADGSVMAKQTVTSGSVTIERDAEEEFYIGLAYDPLVRTMPVEAPQAQIPPSLGKKKRIHSVTLRVDECGEFLIQNRPVSFKKFGAAGAGSPLDVPPPVLTGDKRLRGFLGWNNQGQIEISQTEPLPLRVLAMNMEVSF